MTMTVHTRNSIYLIKVDGGQFVATKVTTTAKNGLVAVGTEVRGNTLCLAIGRPMFIGKNGEGLFTSPVVRIE